MSDELVPTPEDVAVQEVDNAEVQEDDNRLQRYANRLDKIDQLGREVDNAETLLDDARDLVKVRKAEFDAAVARLRAVVKESRDQDDEQPPLPFGDTEDNSWREVSLAIALSGVPSSITEKLFESGLTTVGHLADFTAEKSLTDVAGIGPAKAEIVEQALEKFWASRKEVSLDGMDDAE